LVNAVTTSRGLLSLTGLAFFALGNPVAGTSCFITAAATEIDGTLARSWKVVSEYGAKLDAYVDCVFFMAATIATALLFQQPLESTLLPLAVEAWICTKFVELNINETRKYLKSHNQPKNRKNIR
jgi:phosphatidylglycerophosphate synthase